MLITKLYTMTFIPSQAIRRLGVGLVFAFTLPLVSPSSMAAPIWLNTCNYGGSSTLAVNLLLKKCGQSPVTISAGVVVQNPIEFQFEPIAYASVTGAVMHGSSGAAAMQGAPSIGNKAMRQTQGLPRGPGNFARTSDWGQWFEQYSHLGMSLRWWSSRYLSGFGGLLADNPLIARPVSQGDDNDVIGVDYFAVNGYRPDWEGGAGAPNLDYFDSFFNLPTRSENVVGQSPATSQPDVDGTIDVPSQTDAPIDGGPSSAMGDSPVVVQNSGSNTTGGTTTTGSERQSSPQGAPMPGTTSPAGTGVPSDNQTTNEQVEIVRQGPAPTPATSVPVALPPQGEQRTPMVAPVAGGTAAPGNGSSAGASQDLITPMPFSEVIARDQAPVNGGITNGGTTNGSITNDNGSGIQPAPAPVLLASAPLLMVAQNHTAGTQVPEAPLWSLYLLGGMMLWRFAKRQAKPIG